VPESRRFPRKSLLYYLEVRDATTGTPLGRLVDVSPSGLRLTGTPPLSPSQRYRLRIIPPDDLPLQDELVLETVCRWCGPDVNPDLTAAGLAIVDPTPAQSILLDDLIHWLGLAT